MARKSRKIKAKQQRTVFYVAMEGSVTERKYFDALISKYDLRNVYLLKKSPTRSSPHDVIKRLDQQAKKRKNDHGNILDEKYWAVFDTDNRPIRTLRQVASKAARKKYCLAVSNPCFELWLLLHYGSLANMKGLEGSAATGGCESTIAYLKRRYDKTYEKSTLEPSEYVERVAEAINNATASDSDEDDAWMASVSSRVYKLVESIIESATSPNNPRN